MPESAFHIYLVEHMASWIRNNFLSGENGSILIDHPESSPHNKPPQIGNYIPDLFVYRTVHYGIILGEAKTFYDIENKHTEDQIKTFLKYLVQIENGIFVFTIPWQMSRFAKNYLKYLQKQTGAMTVNIVILTEFS